MRCFIKLLKHLAAFVLSVLIIGSRTCVYAAGENPDLLQRDGIRLYQQQKYSEATKLLSTACSIKPTDLTTHYYLGMSALGARNFDQAKASLSRVVVMTKKESQQHQSALTALERYCRLTPYSCLQFGEQHKTGTTVRWTKESMPLKIFVSRGLQLPDYCYRDFMNNAELRETCAQIKRHDFIPSLGNSVNYQPEYRQYAIDGIKEWEFANNEGLVMFAFTEKPQEADIAIFWCPTLPGVGGVTNIPAAGCDAVIMQIAVDLYLNVQPSARVSALKSLVAHEFGHAIGLAHTEIRESIMNPIEGIVEIDRTRFPSVSENDRATLRALYTAWPGVPMNPGIWLFSTTKRK